MWPALAGEGASEKDSKRVQRQFQRNLRLCTGGKLSLDQERRKGDGEKKSMCGRLSMYGHSHLNWYIIPSRKKWRRGRRKRRRKMYKIEIYKMGGWPARSQDDAETWDFWDKDDKGMRSSLHLKGRSPETDSKGKKIVGERFTPETKFKETGGDSPVLRRSLQLRLPSDARGADAEGVSKLVSHTVTNLTETQERLILSRETQTRMPSIYSAWLSLAGTPTYWYHKLYRIPYGSV